MVLALFGGATSVFADDDGLGNGFWVDASAAIWHTGMKFGIEDHRAAADNGIAGGVGIAFHSRLL